MIGDTYRRPFPCVVIAEHRMDYLTDGKRYGFTVEIIRDAGVAPRMNSEGNGTNERRMGVPTRTAKPDQLQELCDAP